MSNVYPAWWVFPVCATLQGISFLLLGAWVGDWVVYLPWRSCYSCVVRSYEGIPGDPQGDPS